MVGPESAEIIQGIAIAMKCAALVLVLLCAEPVTTDWQTPGDG